MKTIDLFFDAQEIALFMSCFRLNKEDLRLFLREDEDMSIKKE
jgi:hypothetical protein